MAKTKQVTEKNNSKGVCGFCQSEFAKNKITQHLKSCKARTAMQIQKNSTPQHLLHLLVEGTYRPSYWMHLEASADATLYDLDGFLRDIWLECCGHLSAFSIGDVSYTSSPEDDWETIPDSVEKNGEVIAEGAEKEETLPSLEDLSEQISTGLSSELQADLKDVPLAQIEDKLVQMLSENLPPGLSSLASPEFRPFLSYMASALQHGTLASELESLETEEDGEQDMEIELGKVLTVGKKFSYVYDFGSSTNLSLRVIAERDGTLPTSSHTTTEREDKDEEIAIVVMARNEQPALVCRICGKPAVHVLPEWEYDYLDEAGLCDTCAKKQRTLDELLPVVNSPRMGVCGYTGESDEDDWEGADEDEDENES